MKILLAGGGTGGHLYPAIAIANELRYRHPDWEIEFAGRHNSIEGRVCPKEGYVIHNLHVSGYERFYSKWEKAKVIGRLMISIKDSFVLLHKTKPDIVIGTGGYICGPIVLAGHFKKLPTLISEQNVVPGFTIKTLSRFADTVCIPFEEARKFMHFPERCVLTGNPIRREFSLMNRKAAREGLNLKAHEKLVLSFGGSLGSKSINESVAGLLPKIAKNPDIIWYHVAGEYAYDECMKHIHEIGFEYQKYKNIHILKYTNDMPMMLNAADLVISRSGAMSLSEINVVGVPAIYIPYPEAVNDHQTKNARVSENNGAAILIEDKNLTSELLDKTVSELLSDETELRRMAGKSRELGISDSAGKISDEVEKLLQIK